MHNHKDSKENYRQMEQMKPAETQIIFNNGRAGPDRRRCGLARLGISKIFATSRCSNCRGGQTMNQAQKKSSMFRKLPTEKIIIPAEQQKH